MKGCKIEKDKSMFPFKEEEPIEKEEMKVQERYIVSYFYHRGSGIQSYGSRHLSGEGEGIKDTNQYVIRWGEEEFSKFS